MSDSQILVTGRHFTGHGLRAVEPVVQELIISAKEEIHILAYLITETAIPLFRLLKDPMARGVKVTIVINNYEGCSGTVKEELQSLRQSGHIKVIDFSDSEGSLLHAKVLVMDRTKAVFGSANFSWGGMVANHEIGVLLEGSAAWTLANLIDNLISRISPL
jgi:phosphatidylserine/phosphatidylglycerophosphate/cardiolipin synthase-like enzyme